MEVLTTEFLVVTVVLVVVLHTVHQVLLVLHLLVMLLQQQIQTLQLLVLVTLVVLEQEVLKDQAVVVVPVELVVLVSIPVHKVDLVV